MQAEAEQSIVLGLTGNKYAGKSTFANHLQAHEERSQYLASSDVVMDVANKWLQELSETDVNNIGKSVSIREFPDQWIKTLPKIVENITGKNTDYEKLRIDRSNINPASIYKLYQYVKAVKTTPELTKQAISRENKEQHRDLLQWLGGYLVENVDRGVWYDVISKQAEVSVSSGARLIVVDGLRFEYDELTVRRLGGTVIRLLRSNAVSDGDITEQSDKNVYENVRIFNDSSIENLGKLAVNLYNALRFNEFKATAVAPIELSAMHPNVVPHEPESSIA